jgi:hypothetical protein
MRNTIFFIMGLIFALWFALTAWFWVYLVNLFYSYPVGLLGLCCWLIIRNENKMRTKIIPIVLLIGLTASLAFLVFLMF